MHVAQNGRSPDQFRSLPVWLKGLGSRIGVDGPSAVAYRNERARVARPATTPAVSLYVDIA
jgi:hypothetical protein